MTSFLIAIINDYADYADDDNTRGQELYDLLFDKDGECRDDFTDNYLEWVNECLDLAQIPEGPFRKLYIRDMMYESEMEEVCDVLRDHFQSSELSDSGSKPEHPPLPESDDDEASVATGTSSDGRAGQ